MSLIYLAGPIANMPGRVVIDWRIYAAKVLRKYDIQVRDPMRGKEKALGAVGLISTNRHIYENNGPFFTSRAIMLRDYNDVHQADALLVNLLNSTTPSLGTIMELAWAFAVHKPAVVVLENTNNAYENHPMVFEAMPFRVTTLDEGIQTIVTILGKV